MRHDALLCKRALERFRILVILLALAESAGSIQRAERSCKLCYFAGELSVPKVRTAAGNFEKQSRFACVDRSSCESLPRKSLWGLLWVAWSTMLVNCG
jgi:hypothetical protein